MIFMQEIIRGVCVLVVQAAKELSSYDAYEPQQCQSLVMKVQCGAAILVVTNISPVDIKTYSTRGESCLVLKANQLPMASEIMEPRGEPTTINLPDQPNS